MSLWTYIKSLNETLVMALFALTVFVLFFIYQSFTTRNVAEFKCPGKYQTSQEYLEDLAKWIRVESDKNPKLSSDELLVLRNDEFNKHNCSPSPWSYEFSEIPFGQQTTNPTIEFNEKSSVVNVTPTDKTIKFLGKEYGPYVSKNDNYTKVRNVHYPLVGQTTGVADEEISLNFYLQGVWADEEFSSSDFANQFVNGSQENGDNILTHFEAPDPTTRDPAFFIVSSAVYPEDGYGYVFLSKITSIGSDTYSVLFAKKLIGTKDLNDKISKWAVENGAPYLTAVGNINPDSSWLKFSDSFKLRGL
ncbi:MAG: hypothetical protein A2836_00680 [Candidatus Taylorbacteria bacterium RIFCSPHIGHO2_01_FULL_45_63]|uniref:Uncharacterized protein n=1 Tax=Candidatus Taylorbacteria bacterium RIFCSPHIGHO2_02_FULL_45_35 TaxID=1802311 RepID=A0A1G2MTU6_9BACT|nr:MAG: hypothetical protein A2836_00680 [Candidatus Taylorbacteria bacterium RIFCSPHIGHO2_01_FULL_45_63]OHA27134.1 MAG: hypothetical protein A3D56_03380 [Candidatus Taylorbacteria bacterium RIFCSPHIGHO2_02_FULL_45_35]